MKSVMVTVMTYVIPPNVNYAVGTRGQVEDLANIIFQYL